MNHLLSIALRGTDVECSTCGWQGRRFPSSQCPRCRSLARHRLIVFALTRFGVAIDGKTLLHIGPNQLEIDGIRRYGRPRLYLKTDLRTRPFIDVLADATALPLATASLDLVIAWHVLEHIPQDRAVIAELWRVVRPGGAVLMSVPIYPPGRAVTDEDPAVPASARLTTYGHDDHVRACGLDYAQRFADAGFRVRTLSIDDLVRGGENLARHGLSRSHVAWLCERP